MGREHGTRSARLRRRWIVMAMAAIGVLSAGVILSARYGFAAETSGDGQTCGRPGSVTDKQVVDQSVLIPAPTQPVGFTWTYGADDPVHRMTTILTWQTTTGRPAPLAIGDRLGLLVPSEVPNPARDDAIPQEQVSAVATVTAIGVEVSMCVDTSHVKPGRYAAALTFADQRVHASPIVIDVVVKNRAQWLPIAALVVGIALALMVLILSLASSDSPKPLAAVIATVLIAFVAMLATMKQWATWKDDPTWGDDPLLDWLALMATTSFALMGAIATGDTMQGIKSAMSGRSTPTEAGPSEGAP